MINSLLPVISLIIAIAVFSIIKNPLKKYSAVFYVAAAILSVYMVYSSFTGMRNPAETGQLQKMITGMFTRGAFATSIFIIVMYVAVSPKKSWFRKTFSPIRGELSIIGCIIILIHNFVYGKRYFTVLFTDPMSMKPHKLAATLISIALITIMIPLFITSFGFVRRRMKAVTWKKVQKTAYLFYALIYVHVMTLYVFGYSNAVVNRPEKAMKYLVGIVFYTAVYGIYTVSRVYIAGRKRSVKTELGRA